MKRAAWLVLFLFATPLWAQRTNNLALLLHSTAKIGGRNYAMWTVMPNVTHRSEKQLLVLGPRFAGENWWLEPMAGTFIIGGELRPLLDFRASYTRGRYSAFSILQVVRPDGGADVSPFVELDYNLTKKLLVGIETDNEFQPGPDTRSFGPHVGYALTDTIFAMAAYQKHVYGHREVWLRLVFRAGS